MSSALPFLPVVTLASVDVVARGAAVGGMLCDAPDGVAVVYDIEPGAGDRVTLHRSVSGSSGVREREAVVLEHGCLSCTLREDLLPTLHRLAEDDLPFVVLGLPVTAEPLAVVRALQSEVGRLRAAAVVTAIDGEGLVDDVLGDATLAERGSTLFPGDRRALGEVLAHQVEYSDVVASISPLSRTAARLVSHLAVPQFRIDQIPVHGLDPRHLGRVRRPSRDPRGDLQAVTPPTADDGDGVWTIDLRAERPLHPGRFLERVEALGAGRLRSRGHVWLASRPELACAWDGAGGQVSIGALGPWSRGRASTRIVVTGTEPSQRRRVARAFHGLELTAEEHARGSHWWVARGDDLDPWLGDLADCA